ncbi:hypothetical protein M6B38_372045 [Iris pallida]|uniref:Uncharacterized protein n=1 Tax=Iris pallida TaxID=29817 RepID=A0AAX6GCN9_IRIPA|nr:hypothetical protein M6B38_372045 [Iris pallida]
MLRRRCLAFSSDDPAGSHDGEEAADHVGEIESRGSTGYGGARLEGTSGGSINSDGKEAARITKSRHRNRR